MLRLSDHQIIRLSVIILSLFFLSSVALAQYPIFYGEEVVVTALRIPRLKSTVPWNTKVISRKDIEASTATKLGDIIRAVPGLAVKANGGLSSQISTRLRGSNSQQVLVLLNGNRINSPSLGTFDLGDILLSDVEKIEIVKGPLSPAYGADAVGGVINVITLGRSDELKHDLMISYGDYATRKVAFTGTSKAAAVSATYLDSEGFRDNADYTANDVSLRLFLGNFEAGVKKYNADKGSPGSLDFLTPQARQTDSNLFYDLVYQVDAVGFKTSLSTCTLDQTYTNPTWAILSTHKTTTTNYNLQQVIDWFPAQTWLVGLELRNDQSQSTNSGNHDLSNKAVFLQDEIQAAKGLKIVLGAREDISSGYGDHLSPRVGLSWRIKPDTIVKCSWGTSFKAPTIDDLYWAKTTEPGWPSGVITTEGNPNLLPESSASVDITLEKRIDFKTTARLSYFQNRINDMIRWTNTSSSTTDAYWTPRNINDAAIEGVEFELERQINDELKGFANFSYETAKDKATDNFLDYAPQIQYNAGLTYDKNRVSSTAVVRHIGERYADLGNFTKLTAYTVVDLSLSKTMGRWQVKADVENLFNEAYAESYGFTDVYPMPGRRYNIGVSTKI